MDTFLHEVTSENAACFVFSNSSSSISFVSKYAAISDEEFLVKLSRLFFGWLSENLMVLEALELTTNAFAPVFPVGVVWRQGLVDVIWSVLRVEFENGVEKKTVEVA